jgi:hypothetical protein
VDKRPLAEPLSVRAVVFYAVVSDEIQRVIEFFPDRQAAEAMLAEVLGDKPERRDSPSRRADRARVGDDELAGAGVAVLRGSGGRGA